MSQRVTINEVSPDDRPISWPPISPVSNCTSRGFRRSATTRLFSPIWLAMRWREIVGLRRARAGERARDRVCQLQARSCADSSRTPIWAITASPGPCGRGLMTRGRGPRASTTRSDGSVCTGSRPISSRRTSRSIALVQRLGFRREGYVAALSHDRRRMARSRALGDLERRVEANAPRGTCAGKCVNSRGGSSPIRRTPRSRAAHRASGARGLSVSSQAEWHLRRRASSSATAMRRLAIWPAAQWLRARRSARWSASPSRCGPTGRRSPNRRPDRGSRRRESSIS